MRARSSVHPAARGGWFRSLAGATVASTLLLTVGAFSASAAPVTDPPVVSQGEGRLLTVELLNDGIDQLVALNGAQAVNTDASGAVTRDVPLDLELLSALQVTVPAGLVSVFGTDGILQLGAVGQYAAASDDASSLAFSGTVSASSSLVGVSTVTPGSDVGDPGTDTSALINVSTADILGGANLADLSVRVGVVAAGATQSTAGVQSGNYTLSDLEVVVGGTLLAGTISAVGAQLNPIIAGVNALVATPIVNPLAGGTVTVDLDALLAVAGVASVNDLAPGTNLLQYLPAAVVAQVTTSVNTLLTNLNDAITGLGIAGAALATLLAAAQPLVVGILDGLATSLEAPLGTAVDALLQLDVNTQSTSAGGTFTQTALTVGVGTAGSLVQIGLANASVGPNQVSPVASSLSPTSGPTSGGTVVTITGEGFTGATGVTFDGTPGTGFSVDSDTQITVTSPPHAAGAVDVVVQHPAGDSDPLTFTYVQSAAATSLNPTSGPETGGTVVTISGAGFTGATGVTFDGTPGSSFSVDSDTQITVTSPAHDPGTVDVVVQHPGGDAAPLDFEFMQLITVTGVTPGSGPSYGGTEVTVSGSCFTGATGVTIGGVLVPAAEFVSHSDSEIVFVTPANDVGVVDVTVHGAAECAGDETVPDGFEYLDVDAPVITDLTPDSGPESGGTVVTITGEGFTDATGVLFGETLAASFVVDSDSQITVTTPAHAPGVVDVYVLHLAGASEPGEFTFTPLIDVADIDPGFGPEDGGTEVTITGVCFTDATGVTIGGVTVPASEFSTHTGTVIVFETPAHAPGVVDVTIHGTAECGGDATVTDGFEYISDDAPVLASLSPDNGPESGGTTVVITGSGFTDASGVTFGDVPAASFTVDSDTQITVTTPVHAPGVVDVRVLHTDGTSAPLEFEFTPVTTIDDVDPDEGPTEGGTWVTITGYCFLGATGVLFGDTPAQSFNVVSDSTIVALSPAGSGTVDITVLGSLECGGDDTVEDGFTYVSPGLGSTGAQPLPALLTGLGLLLAGAALYLLRRRLA